MNGAFDVRTTARFDRLLKKLAVRHRQEAGVLFAEALRILEADPHNRTRQHDIKKLEDVPPGDGQFRLKLGRWRFRFDVDGHVVPR
jgi:mRNA-degrading endonuclease RelE of RelBE toxin-antitoxin system